MSQIEEVDKLRAEIESLRAGLDEANARMTKLRAEHDRETAALVEGHKLQTERLRSGEIARIEQIDRLRKELAEQLDDEMARTKELERDLRQARRQLEAVYRSRTWRTGAALARVLRPKKRPRPTIPPAPAPAEPRARPAPTAVVPASPSAGRPSLSIHPLADLYRAEVASSPTENGIGFAVFTVGFDRGRGDLFVATGLGRHLRDMGLGPFYRPQEEWYEMPESLTWIVAMMPAFQPSRAPFGPRIIGWARNEIGNWLAHDELDLFDLIVCSSQVVANEIRKVYSGPVEILPIGVDTDLFAAGTPSEGRFGVATTVNQWGRERDVYRALRSGPVTFELSIYGHTMGLPAELEPYHRGQVDFFELPDVYRKARIVLDDFNHSTIGWGAVNSRIYEALAAGALPITNSRLGLEELGLAEVPTYREPGELNPMIQGFLDDPEGTEQLVERLGRVVRERHAFERRSRQLVEILSRAPEAPVVKRVIGFAPDYRQGNPFQEMLYSRRRSHGVAAFPTDVATFATDGILSRFRDRERILHLHWTTPVMTYATTEAEAMVRMESVLRAIDAFKAEGGHFVWTIHNVLPHDTPYADLEAHLSQELAYRADLVHVMCAATHQETGELYRLPAGRTVVIPHSNYNGVYPDAADRDLARARLGVQPDDVALLVLGAVRRYKGMDRLLEAFDRAVRREPRLVLIVAGKTDPSEELAEIEEALAAHPRVMANLNEILPEDLQYLYKASDAAVIPHRRVLNSGALLLAYTFGVPVVAPRVGCLAELLEKRASIGFDVHAAEALEDALVASPSLQNEEARRAAREIAASRPVEEMSTRFFEALDGIF